MPPIHTEDKTESNEKIESVTVGKPLSPGARLWRNRNFNIFWFGQTLSSLGDAFEMIALPLLVLQATGSVAQMGLVTGTMGLGRVLAGIFAGLIVDRVNRRHLMIFCDFARAVVYCAIPLTWWFASTQLWLLYLVTFIGACLAMFFQVAYNTAIANLVDRDQITNANGRLQTSFGVSFIAGPMLAGLVCATVGPAVAIGINAISFVISAITIIFLRLRQSSAIRTKQQSLLKDWLEGASFLFQQPILRTVTILLGIQTMVMAAIGDLFIYYVKHNLKWDDNAVGLVFGISAVGAIIGGITFSTIRRKLGFGVCFLGSMAIGGLLMPLVNFSENFWIITLIVAIIFATDTIRGNTSVSLRQVITPDHLLGRVTSVFLVLVTALGPVGAAIITVLAEQWGAALMFTIIGVVSLLLATIGLFTPARKRFPEKAYL
jgi:MFS family permease